MHQELSDGLDIKNELSHDYSREKFQKSEILLREEIFPALRNDTCFFLMNQKVINEFI